MAAVPANHQRSSDDAAEATQRQRGRSARSGATRGAKPSRPTPHRKAEPAPAAQPVDEVASAAPEPVAEAARALSEPLAAAVQATQALAAAPAVPPQVATVPRLWPGAALRAGQAVLESGLRLQGETFAFAAAQMARNWKAGQALARCRSVPAALAVQRELIEETVRHGSTSLGSLSRLAAEAMQAALPPLDRR